MKLNEQPGKVSVCVEIRQKIGLYDIGIETWQMAGLGQAGDVVVKFILILYSVQRAALVSQASSHSTLYLYGNFIFLFTSRVWNSIHLKLDPRQVNTSFTIEWHCRSPGRESKQSILRLNLAITHWHWYPGILQNMRIIEIFFNRILSDAHCQLSHYV